MSDDMELEDRLAPPMANGDLLFEAPWQGRVFGIARVLCEQGYYHWDDFRQALIDKISRWDESHREHDPYTYYDHFLAALTDLLSDKNLCDLSELMDRDQQFQTRPHGHDH
jgi:nitrile hydratase accessory protein